MGGTRQLSSLRDIVKDEEPLFVVLAVITVHEGESSHWYKTKEGHIAVTCKTQRHGAPLDAILPTHLGNSRGVFGIPDVGTEVAIGFDHGDYEGDAFVLAVYGSVIPSVMDDTKVAIVGEEVHVIAPGGEAKSLMTKDDGQAILDYIQGAGTGGAPILVLGVAGGAASVATSTPPDLSGTSVLRGQ